MLQVVVLTGNICSGKSTFAKLLEREGFQFFPIEELKKSLKFKEKSYDKNQDSLYAEYANQIIALGKNQKLIVESTGGNKSWPACFKEIKEEFGSKLITIKINTSKDICLLRFMQNKKGHRANTRKNLIGLIDERLSKDQSADITLDNNSTKEDFLKKANPAVSQILNL